MLNLNPNVEPPNVEKERGNSSESVEEDQQLRGKEKENHTVSLAKGSKIQLACARLVYDGAPDTEKAILLYLEEHLTKNECKTAMSFLIAQYRAKLFMRGPGESSSAIPPMSTRIPTPPHNTPSNSRK